MFNKIKRLFYHLSNHPKQLFNHFWHIMAPCIPDRLYLKVEFWFNMGYWPNLDSPTTFNEKLQYLKLESKKHPEYTTMVDKVAAKDYVSSIIGSEYLIPTLGVWNSVDEIDWSNLPNQFVIKAAGDSGGIVICKDKSKLDIEKSKLYLKRNGERNYCSLNREFPYRDVPHRYIAEMYMEDEEGIGLKDYKFFCFDGEPLFVYISQGMEDHSTARISFLNIDWTQASFGRSDYASFEEIPVKPKNYEMMLNISRRLSKGIPHVRIDLYNVDGNIFFGEMTFFTCSGMIPFEPNIWDYKLGEYINLP